MSAAMVVGIFVQAEVTLKVSEPQDLALVTYPVSSPRSVALKLSLASFERTSLVFPPVPVPERT